ncbi:hypothetical protein [Mobiluncus porci]|uniref:Uncharacterized protein n=1 Tax=Mobiluncus porci TaxID=2652278 RepID=A0A7K0K1Y0_9ACTO|nr:hypothetical protein [Mobiluncus porci]MST49497.1 hypothetical protein [Mobiluncus porci]
MNPENFINNLTTGELELLERNLGVSMENFDKAASQSVFFQVLAMIASQRLGKPITMEQAGSLTVEESLELAQFGIKDATPNRDSIVSELLELLPKVPLAQANPLTVSSYNTKPPVSQTSPF